VKLFLPSLEECSRLGVHTTQQALDFIGNRVKLPGRIMGRTKSLEVCVRASMA
jgi:hypothetical protein